MASDDGAHRPLICGSETPQPPFPVYLQGQVEHGFGRGSKQLNCPTANLPIASLDDPRAELGVEKTGVYFGFAQVAWHSETSVKDSEREVYPMVMSIGWNPHFKNTKKTVEVHILHDYPDDFYGQDMRVVVLGYIRPEKQYDSLGMLCLYSL
ncbi:riboflavin kinase [Malassezia yamatoensis]|uniref:Riboflavin kinase n=1 Tax=Malassezia yamatoensis TaxID=253288 RepID=A0AAJ6CGA0_9BASI|nr:riboflavin kinase [Malassezia yamatoensis]